MLMLMLPMAHKYYQRNGKYNVMSHILVSIFFVITPLLLRAQLDVLELGGESEYEYLTYTIPRICVIHLLPDWVTVEVCGVLDLLLDRTHTWYPGRSMLALLLLLFIIFTNFIILLLIFISFLLSSLV
jgi:hypothetical protein